MGYARLLRRLSDAACDFVDDDVVVGGVAAQEAAEADDRVKLFGFGQRARGGGNFEGAGNANNFDIISPSTARQAINCASKQSLGDECIEAGDHNRKPLARSAQIAFDRGNWRVRRRFNLQAFYVLVRDLLLLNAPALQKRLCHSEQSEEPMHFGFAERSRVVHASDTQQSTLAKTPCLCPTSL